MHSVVISGTGLYQPPHVITNAELVDSFNRYVDLQNAEHAEAIAAGTREALVHSNVEFIEKASGIKQRYVIEKEGVLDPTRMYPRFEERADDQLSLMAEIAVDAARKALAAAGKKPEDVDAVFCSAANMQRAYPAMAVEICAARGSAFSERSEFSIRNSCMPPMRSIGRTAMAITMMPMPPSHCRMPRHRRIPGGAVSSPVITVAPVVVTPDIASKKASV